MKKLLVVGCGGSGGMALSYMMDQLLSELGQHGVKSLPEGWQFLHVDVPSAPPPARGGVQNVRDLGGAYAGIGPQATSYASLDNALTQRLAQQNQLDAVATWAPRDPQKVHVPIGEGAGQYRALGRMITLSRTEKLYDELSAAWSRLTNRDVNTEMRIVADAVPGIGAFEAEEGPLVFVVSSMAGGAGASMALDVCRTLTLVPGVNPEKIGVFMVTPDIFSNIEPSQVSGTRPNALAMLGEIVASQTGAARKHDVELLRALGRGNGEGATTPFKRVFPVGAHVGAERTQFGDGSPGAVYRGLGRGLAALVTSDSAIHSFIEYDLTNPAGNEGSREFLGWGNEQWANIPWGTFGFASLSMGRDRYAEYAAQRLARASADRLLFGHRQPQNPASDEEQVNAILDNQWSNICRNLGLPDIAQGVRVGDWLAGTVVPQDQMARHARAIVDATVRPLVDQQPKVNAAHWAGALNRVLTEQRDPILRAANDTAYGIAYSWAQQFSTALEGATTQALAELGMPYATGMVRRISRTVQDSILPEATSLADYRPANVTEPSAEVQNMLAHLKGAMENTAVTAEKVFESLVANVTTQLYAALSYTIANAAGAMVGELFEPLIRALDEAQAVLRRASSAPKVSGGLADLRTDVYAAWPAESDERVAERFSEADNEVMLTSSSEFKARYELDLPGSVGQRGNDPLAVQNAVRTSTGMVITGLWPTVTGQPAPGEVQPTVERTSSWVSKAFTYHPETGETQIASAATFDVHVRPAEILTRARTYVARPGQSFDRYCSLSLRDYITGTVNGVDQHVPENTLAAHRRDLLLKFAEAVQLARPLASVNEAALNAVHTATEMKYIFKFSTVPFQGLPVADDLLSELIAPIRIDNTSAAAFEAALSSEKSTKRIDIFGSYPNYSPLVYESVGTPAANQWLAASDVAREEFWRWRRSRPLEASLPMHPKERRAMVAGWILGRGLGRVQTPAAPFNQPVQVWDAEARRWLPFPHPLLTPPSKFKADYDWLPAVMESVLLAIATSHQPPVMTSLHPYRALRRTFDTSPFDPAAGLHGFAATDNMAQWLRTGQTGTGIASAVDDGDPGRSIDDRAAALRKYFDDYHAFVGHHFMKPGEGIDEGLPPAPGGGTFSIVSTRAVAAETPLFRDLAADIYWATAELSQLLDQAVSAAKAPTGQGWNPTVPTDTPAAVQAPEPGIGGGLL